MLDFIRTTSSIADSFTLTSSGLKFNNKTLSRLLEWESKV